MINLRYKGKFLNHYLIEKNIKNSSGCHFVFENPGLGNKYIFPLFQKETLLEIRGRVTSTSPHFSKKPPRD